LLAQFGGAPEISFQCVTNSPVKLEIPDMPVSCVDICQRFTDVPDLNPIRISIVSDQFEQKYAQKVGVIVSQYIGLKVFLN
jgi:hypothetical protein